MPQRARNTQPGQLTCASVSFKLSRAQSLARFINVRADVIREELREHVRSETWRIYQAEKRARGLRLYVAWSLPRNRHVDPAIREDRPAHQPAA